jgi:hypothetical protein
MSAWALQRAVYAALSNDSTVTGLLGGARIHDDVPQSADFPFVTLGTASISDWSTGTEPGLEHRLDVHVWSRYAGKREAFAVIDAVRAILHDASLSLSGAQLVNLRCQSFEVRRDEDGETYHGVARFRAVTEPA